MTFSKALLVRAEAVLNVCKQQRLMVATAESCTGGLLAGLLTSIAGSSQVFERGFVTYSNEAKHSLLGVSASIIKRHGAVSSEVALAMAKGALKNSQAQIAVSITGIAGPGGGTKTKPVGLVYIALAGKKRKSCVQECHFKGSREKIRLESMKTALIMMVNFLYQ